MTELRPVTFNGGHLHGQIRNSNPYSLGYVYDKVGEDKTDRWIYRRRGEIMGLIWAGTEQQYEDEGVHGLLREIMYKPKWMDVPVDFYFDGRLQ